MEIGEIITDQDRIAEYYWHPHSLAKRTKSPHNALYIPSETLSFFPDRKGYGVLEYREDRVLTMRDHNRSTWRALEFLMPSHTYGNKKNSAKGEGLYYCGIWQELVIFESEGLVDWVKSILE